ncbi:MAG: flavodoxin family protein [Clostridiaceae bacterium]|nr:flavodoxin family protein [Clostridiaceae bacterium]
MKILILSGNPKKQGLCQSMIDAVKAGAAEGGAAVEEIRLSDIPLIRCQVCDNGWGICLSENRCKYGDDGFTALMAQMESADVLVLATPVYWGEMAESLKCFLDRLRRCVHGPTSFLAGKQALLLATPGGSGNGQLTCWEQLDRFCRHTGLIIFDYIGANRWTSDYKRQSAYAAGKALAEGRRNGMTI